MFVCVCVCSCCCGGGGWDLNVFYLLFVFCLVFCLFVFSDYACFSNFIYAIEAQNQLTIFVPLWDSPTISKRRKKSNARSCP